jgi:hypothetical protein
MIRAVTGMPGEGKTCFAVQHIIIEELKNGTSPIYTNIVFNFDALETFLEKEGYKADLTRIHKLEEDQIGLFWEHIPNGCLVVLDEVAEYFNSQAWKVIGRDAGTWARQHRKLGHEPYLVVQELSHIFKQFRDLVGEEIKITNLNNHKMLGFRLPKIFNAKWCWKDAKTVSRSKMYRFDTDVFSVYDTLATSGVLERGEVHKCKETEKKRKLKPFKRFMGFLGEKWQIVVPVTILAVVMSMAVFLPKILGGSDDLEITETKKITENEEDIPPDNMYTQSDSSGGNRKSSSKGIKNGRYNSIAKRTPSQFTY